MRSILAAARDSLPLHWRIARRVVGIEPSDYMLAGCESHPRIEYKRSVAERIPTDAEEFDLVTVAHAFHWLDQDAFLAEVGCSGRVDGS